MHQHHRFSFYTFVLLLCLGILTTGVPNQPNIMAKESTNNRISANYTKTEFVSLTNQLPEQCRTRKVILRGNPRGNNAVSRRFYDTMLPSNGYTVTRIDRLLTVDDLIGVDLVIFDLNDNYPIPSISEVAIVQAWLANGGGLLLLNNSNIVANIFGVTFTNEVLDRTDAEFSWGSGGTVWYDWDVHYQRDNFLAHEITNNINSIFLPRANIISGPVTPIVITDSDAIPANATVVGQLNIVLAV